MIPEGVPAADATIVRYGLRRFLWSLLFVPVTLVSGGVGVAQAVYGRGDGLFAVWGPVVFILMALLFAVPVVSSWRTRRWAMAFDATGFWWVRGKEMALIRWDSLAGVGICWAHPVFCVELCPRDAIDRDDPLLGQFVRDTEPLRPGLPRLRYSIRLPHAYKPYEQALHRWAPELWFGVVAQPPAYAGRPDRAGLRGRAARRGED
ncbi:hypothetical protein PV755_39570 [Streptomyces caniscabiei]|uniref:Uncharacterized protein n=1 Tax=Streptomyces caniscabiei TaxID=2746961 RepID=A0A927LCI6_9ACTN|nr:hypothetical protein [Streptomyces caniscabiei]MBD9729213.1 hypothetical protein [Streptomyces caniscabiei]MDX3514946.1 hypothetical protein [Streptomyces caniscabiei]MDX3724199.1 hypothetical protein [Streptomyces caniscabiei]WEO25138.1 hypothetical protein IHE65_19225 [Streptomyces caniscabiei]